EENKDYEQIIDEPLTDASKAPYINLTLRKEGANLTQMFGEEHNSQGNYFWLFSGSNQGVGFRDGIPDGRFEAPNLGTSLISSGRSFKGYSEDPAGFKRLERISTPTGLTPDGRTSALYDVKGTIHVWDTATAKEIRRIAEPPAHWTLALSPDGAMLAALHTDMRVRLWNVA